MPYKNIEDKRKQNREWRKKWYAENPKAGREVMQKWRAADPNRAEESRKAVAAWRKKNPEKVKAQAAWRFSADNPKAPAGKRRELHNYLKRKYGISLEEYEALLKEQNYGCAICGRPDGSDKADRLYVDHCHMSLKVRGLLCSNCNQGLGLFSDDVAYLEMAIKYLKAAPL